jgi:hypothetical protein
MMKKFIPILAIAAVLSGCASSYSDEELMAMQDEKREAEKQHNLAAYGFESVLNVWDCTNADNSGEKLRAVRAMTSGERGQNNPLIITRNGSKTLYKYDAGIGYGVLFLTDPNGKSEHVAQFIRGAYADSYDTLMLVDMGRQSEFHCVDVRKRLEQ